MPIRTIAILGRAPGMTFTEFDRYWREVHAPLAAQVPGVIRYVQRHVVRGADEPDNEFGIDGFAVLDYTSAEAMAAGWASPAGQRALADVPNFLGKHAVTVLDDYVVVERAENDLAAFASTKTPIDFPSPEFVTRLVEVLNRHAGFNTASRWSDVKVVIRFGDDAYWFKLYGGKVIDFMRYFPMANPLGWDYAISAPLEIWRALREGSRVLGHLMDRGEIAVDGNLLQANRMYESTHLMLSAIRDLKLA